MSLQHAVHKNNYSRHQNVQTHMNSVFNVTKECTKNYVVV